MTDEICTRCEKPIDALKPAYINNEKIVCETCDKQLRESQVQTRSQDDPNHGISVVVIFLFGIALAVEILAALYLLLKCTDNTLPEGPVQMAMQARQQAQDAAKYGLWVDAGLIVITISVMLLASIHNVLKKIHHRLGLQSAKPSPD